MAFRNRLNVVFSKVLQSPSTISQTALLKLLRKIPKELKSNKILAILVVVILLIIALVILVITNRLHLIASLIISCIAASCAIISAALASQSLKKTEEALELTRITIRPFLSCQPGNAFLGHGRDIVTLEFHVKNTGPVPANLAIAEIAFFDDSEVIKDDNESKHYPKESQQTTDTVIFPDAVYDMVQKFDLRRNIDKKLYDNIVHGKVTVRFRMKYSAQGREYVTVQTEKLGKGESGLVNRKPIPPQKWT